VAAHEFYLAFELTSRTAPVPMVSDLASRVLIHVGCPEDAIAELVERVNVAVARGVELTSECQLRFRMEDGELTIAVIAEGRDLFQVSRGVI
jgi:hypothetical protein